jgi:peptidoglycan/LPS O-acetylase OafA/YrhL
VLQARLGALLRRRAGAAGRRGTRSESRLAWLDVLRGVAALLVVYEHVGYVAMPHVRDFTNTWVSAGDAGVFLFFAVSGYIIPASLERKGNVRGFWISRIFRLYPLWICVYVTVIVFRYEGWYNSHDRVIHSHPAAALLGHGTMLQDLLGVYNSINVMWSLSYEMAFYLLVTCLFVAGLHRFSAQVAVLFGLAALVLGQTLPMLVITDRLGMTKASAAAAAILLVGVAGATSRRRLLALPAGVLLGATALALLALNSRLWPWQSLLIPAYMFLGTAVYRAERGQIKAWKAGAAAVAVLGCAVGSALIGMLHPGPHAGTFDGNRQYVCSLALAVAVFGAGFVLRQAHFPTPLQWVGRISYSTYLVHPVLGAVFARQLRKYGGAHAAPSHQIGVFLLFVTAVLALGSVTYLVIEAPSQRLGHRLAAHRPTPTPLPGRVGTDAAA